MGFPRLLSLVRRADSDFAALIGGDDTALHSHSPTNFCKITLSGGNGEAGYARFPMGSSGSFAGTLQYAALLDKTAGQALKWIVQPSGGRVTIQDAYLSIQQMNGDPTHDPTVGAFFEVGGILTGYGSQKVISLDPADTDHVWNSILNGFTLNGAKDGVVVPQTGRYLVLANLYISEIEEEVA